MLHPQPAYQTWNRRAAGESTRLPSLVHGGAVDGFARTRRLRILRHRTADAAIHIHVHDCVHDHDYVHETIAL